MKTICMFNHKGGVSKTTTSFHLAWMLAEKGKRVLLVDADSQCNLTSIVIGEEQFEQFYVEYPARNLKSALAPAFEARTVELKAVDCHEKVGRPGLFLVPGSFELSAYELSLAVSFTLSETMSTVKHLPGSLAFLLSTTGKKYEADYAVVDMNPSLSAINQSLLVSSEYFILPTAPDTFSAMAIRSLAQILPKWEKWALRARAVFADATYPLPQVTPKFLGTIIQGYNIRKGQPVKAAQAGIDRIIESVQAELVPRLSEAGMTLDREDYESDDYCLAKIPDFQSLNAKYHENGIPVFSLPDELLGQGTVLEQYQVMRERFRGVFSDLAERILRLTGNARDYPAVRNQLAEGETTRVHLPSLA
ncbi:MAG: AAA family ATPase [Thermodesulfobacteriota bacterium]